LDARLSVGSFFFAVRFGLPATAVPLLLAWAGPYRHYFDVGPYPSTPILISWIAGGVTWWLFDRRIAPAEEGSDRIK
jgi:hypothetical protein